MSHDEFTPLTEGQVKDFLENIETDELEDNLNDYDPSDVVADMRNALLTAKHLHEELRRMKRYAPITGFTGELGSFEHEVYEPIRVEAKFSEDKKEVWIAAYFDARHWKGDKAFAQPCSHAVGFIVSVGDFWTTSPRQETPYKTCRARFCGEELKLLDGENKRIWEQLERSRHANAILMQKLEDVGHPVTQEDLKKMVITLPLEDDDNGPPSNQTT